MPSDRATETAPFRQAIYRFGRFTFNGASQELWADGARRKLEAKPRAVLAALLAQPNFAVSKKDLIEAVWPGKKAVEPGSLLTAIYNLRTALEPDGAEIVESVPGIGYRLAVPVDVSFVDMAAPDLAGLAAGGQVPHREQWRLQRPLSHRATPPAGHPAKPHDVWLARNEKTREARVFKFAATQTRLDELKLESAISTLLFARLGARRDLVRILEWNFKQPPYYIESSYGGPDLRAWFAAQGGIDEVSLARRLDLLVQIARSIGDAHGCGALHGDIKPGNVLIGTSADGTPTTCVADFGAGALTAAARAEALAVTLREPAASGGGSTKTGTFLYMAPEIMAGGPVTAASDIFALGILLYQLVVGDFDRPLATGWQAHIADPVLRDIIAEAVAGDPAQRTNAAAGLADSIAHLEQTRSRLAAERAAAASAAIAAEKMRRARQRRPWLAALGTSLVLGFVGVSLFAWQATQQRAKAERAAQLAQSVNLFLTRDLLGRGTPRNTGKPDETVMQAAANAEPMIARRFSNDPLIAATIYAALARAYDDRSAIAPARDAYDKAVASFERAEGPMSADAAIVRLHSAIMEAGTREAASLATARSIAASVAASLPRLGPRRDEVQVWLSTAKGTISVADGNAADALPALRDAARLAATMPASFDADDRLGMRFREGQALIFAGQYAAARDILAAVAGEMDALHGPRYVDTLIARIQHAQALDLSGDPERCIAEINAIRADLLAVFGPRHREMVVAISVLADAQNSAGHYADAARDEKSAYDLAVATQGAQSFGAINTLAGLATAQCRAGDAEAGLDNASRAFAAAATTFGAKHPITQAFGLVQVQCLVVAKRYTEAQATLRTLDRGTAAKALADPYPGESFDVLEAKIAFELGNVPRTRALLVPLTRAFANDQNDRFFGNWVRQLTAATAR
jgi:DNA-binding winged helix-turn-helix (wHTH) protein/serine/threonine protein kinase